jgi:hypothetical protein
VIVRKSLFPFLLLGAFLTSACTGPRKLTDFERSFYFRAQVSAANIEHLNKEEFVVMNPTRPADWEETTGYEKVSGVIGQIPSDFFWAYRTPAIEHCAQRGQYPTRGQLYGPNARKFRCLSYESWSISYANEELLNGLCKIPQKSGPELRASHPCKDLAASSWRLSDRLCETYSKLLQTTIFESIPCSDLSSRISRVTSQRSRISEEGMQLDFDSAKGKCAALGFTQNTEKFGECVLRLTR